MFCPTKFGSRNSWARNSTRRLGCALPVLPLLLAWFAWAQGAGSPLERVLDQMDKTAASFRSAQASFVWDQYQRVVNETDSQKGKVFYRKNGKDTLMAADITDPDAKYVLVSDGKIQVYQPRIDQVTIYDPGKNRETVESFMVLGFGGGGHDMLKSFDVNYLGTETVSGSETAKLDLTPKTQSVRNSIAHIILWIDPERGVSLQQQLFEPSGDYRLAKYDDIQINQKIPENVFRLKTTGRTKFVSPQG